MTHEKWILLEPEEQRVKVAELRGIKCTCTDGCYGQCNVHDPDDCPDYLNDLNAMHEIELWLITSYHKNGCGLDNAWKRYCDALMDIDDATEDYAPYINATAALKAEAFVSIMEVEQ